MSDEKKNETLTDRKKEVIQSIQRAAEIYTIASVCTKMPYVFCDPETFDDEVFVFLKLEDAQTAAKALAEEGIDARVINIHTIKPIDKEIIIKAAQETGLIITAEEHSVIGGLGSAVADVVCESCPVPVIKVGVNDEFGKSGPAVQLLKKYGLCAENIAETVKKSMSLKK